MHNDVAIENDSGFLCGFTYKPRAIPAAFIELQHTMATLGLLDNVELQAAMPVAECVDIAARYGLTITASGASAVFTISDSAVGAAALAAVEGKVNYAHAAIAIGHWIDAEVEHNLSDALLPEAGVMRAPSDDGSTLELTRMATPGYILDPRQYAQFPQDDREFNAPAAPYLYALVVALAAGWDYRPVLVEFAIRATSDSAVYRAIARVAANSATSYSNYQAMHDFYRRAQVWHSRPDANQILSAQLAGTFAHAARGH